MARRKTKQPATAAHQFFVAANRGGGKRHRKGKR